MTHTSTSDIRNLVITIIVSMGFLFLWHKFIDAPRIEKERLQQQLIKQEQLPSDSSQPIPEIATSIPEIQERDAALTNKENRISINTNNLHGSVSLKGARLDDITLVNYRESLDPASNEVVLFSPSSTARSYFADFGWISATPGITVPNSTTIWKADKTEIKPNEPVTLRWTSPQNVEFNIILTLDAHYLFSIKQQVKNNSMTQIKLTPYAILNRAVDDIYLATKPHTRDTSMILHEGPVGVFNETLEEFDYDEIQESGDITFDNTKGWIGFTDKYWLSALIPDNSRNVVARFSYAEKGNRLRYQSDIQASPQNLIPGEVQTNSFQLFAGAKKVKLLDEYSETYNIPLFDRAVDFGWLYFLTKPIFLLLQYFYSHIHNFGICILLLTVVVKLFLYPIANKSYETMSHMRHLQPKIKQIKDQYKDDRMGFQKAIQELYRKEKMNPAFGCLGLLIQLPIAFALYKVLYVAIEMRHAPFYGWNSDLSAPDPTSVFNAFGLIPWDPPSFMHVGAWPIIFALTMYTQQALQPKPSDPVQANVMKILPVALLFLFAAFPSGLVIYFVWSNILSVLQQWIITRRLEKKFADRQHSH